MTASGNACVNCEHAWGDGLTFRRYIEEVFEDSTKKPVVHPSTAVQTGAANVRKLGMRSCKVWKLGIKSCKDNLGLVNNYVFKSLAISNLTTVH
jgi:hypothetical protein